MDVKDELLFAERLLIAERARLAGAKGYTFDEFKNNMKEAIESGAAHGKFADNIQDCRQNDVRIC